MVVIYSSGSTADPKGRRPHAHGTVLESRPQPEPAARPDPGGPHLLADALLLGRRLRIHVWSRRCTSGRVSTVRTSFEPGKTLDLIEQERITMVAGWPHFGKAMAEHPSFAEARPLLDPLGQPLRPPARGGAPEGPRAAIELARHDRDLRPAHLRPHGGRPAREAARLLRPLRPRRPAQDRGPRDRPDARPRRVRRDLRAGLPR